LGLPIKLSVVPETSGAVSTAIARAIEINGGLHIRYHSMYRDLITERTVMPVNLYESNDHQYVRAFCFSALDYREFRVDRIDQATAATVSSEISATSGNAEKINYSISIIGSLRDVMERFSIPPSAVGSSLDLSSYSQQWIERSVMASGSAAKLNSPLDIRAEVARKARLMLDRYMVE
jgi:proteasome accessory factor C